MTRTRVAVALFSLGMALFVALIAWRGIGAVGGALAAAGWGLALVAAYHVVPLVIDAAAIHVLAPRDISLMDTVFARWAGESVNSLLPAGQLGGPVLMARHLAQRGMPMPQAAAVVTVSTTMQALAQIVFALLGLAAFAAFSAAAAQGHETSRNAVSATLIAGAVLGLAIAAFYCAQRRGLFGRFVRGAAKMFGKTGTSALAARADAIDARVVALYGRRGRILATFLLSLVGWAAGTVEVWLALKFLGHPIGWLAALLLESVGQAIRGAAFAIPGSLGAQEGGYLLLAPLVGLAPETALALSLAKRARELALGLPGIVYLQWSERTRQRRRAPGLPLAD